MAVMETLSHHKPLVRPVIFHNSVGNIRRSVHKVMGRRNILVHIVGVPCQIKSRVALSGTVCIRRLAKIAIWQSTLAFSFLIAKSLRRIAEGLSSQSVLRTAKTQATLSSGATALFVAIGRASGCQGALTIVVKFASSLASQRMEVLTRNFKT